MSPRPPKKDGDTPSGQQHRSGHDRRALPRPDSPERRRNPLGLATMTPTVPHSNGTKREPLFTDTRNAQRLVAMRGDRLRFDHTRGLWRWWDGRRWALDETQRIMTVAKDVVVAMHAEIAPVREKDHDAWLKLRRQVLACESTSRLRALVLNAAPALASTHETWDPDPYMLNCANGVVDLRTGELVEHRPELWQSKLAPVAYDPDALCPTWDAFLARVFDGNASVIDFVQRAAGLSLVGQVVEHVLFVLWGVGANGKSTLLSTMLEVIGDYGRQAANDLLVHRDLPQHTTAIAELRGVRMVSTVETAGSGGRLSEVTVKVLTGGDDRNARFLYQDAFTYTPSDTFWLATNHKPVIRDNSEGIWRRICLIPFRVQIPRQEQDTRLRDKLRAEYPGILAWMVRGCIEWQRRGLDRPPEVEAATAGYRAEVDVLSNFLEDCCVVEAGALTMAQELYERYVQWCQETGEKPALQRFFGLKLTDSGHTRQRVGKARRWAWEGIRLRRPDDLFAPDAPPATVRRTQENPEADPTSVYGSASFSYDTSLFSQVNRGNRESEGQSEMGTKNPREDAENTLPSVPSVHPPSHGAAGEKTTQQGTHPPTPPLPKRADYADEESYLEACDAWGREARAAAERWQEDGDG